MEPKSIMIGYSAIDANDGPADQTRGCEPAQSRLDAAASIKLNMTRPRPIMDNVDTTSIE